MINPDDLDPPRPAPKPVDLQGLSIQDLKEYIRSLEAEIDSAAAMIEYKESHKSGAESLFKIP
ncbi:MAG: DUF1192 domain-containing protein [Bdellovibrionales bacterium]|jgi:uncharacterized small protein (DUF1192 family)